MKQSAKLGLLVGGVAMVGLGLMVASRSAKASTPSRTGGDGEREPELDEPDETVVIPGPPVPPAPVIVEPPGWTGGMTTPTGETVFVPPPGELPDWSGGMTLPTGETVFVPISTDGIPIPSVPGAGGVPPGVMVEPPQMMATQALANQLLAEQTQSNWKYVSDNVKEWQRAVGRTVDGKFGPGDALFMALQVADVPVVRYWPAKDGRNPQAALASYRAALRDIGAQSTVAGVAQALDASAERERGQAFGAPTGDGGRAPVPTVLLAGGGMVV